MNDDMLRIVLEALNKPTGEKLTRKQFLAIQRIRVQRVQRAMPRLYALAAGDEQLTGDLQEIHTMLAELIELKNDQFLEELTHPAPEGKIREHFDAAYAASEHGTDGEIAREITRLSGEPVSRQGVNQWRKRNPDLDKPRK
jgi:hypothetical protein